MFDLITRKVRKPRALGVLLCYNDADILPVIIEHLLNNNHDLVVWNHGSTDNTAEVLERYEDKLVECKFIARSFDFYKLYPEMSRNLIDNYVDKYDWISWPDQDEILEGPARDKSYYEYLTDVFHSRYNWIQFNNFNYWFTEKDNKEIESPVERIKYYSLFPDCGARIRSWRASVTDIRQFNETPLKGERYPELFNLRHYPMRSKEQMKRRLAVDRNNLERGGKNYHYNMMAKKGNKLLLKSRVLNFDDGGELSKKVVFDWNELYRK